MSVCAPVQHTNDAVARSPHSGELAGDESLELGGVGFGVLNMPRDDSKPTAMLRWAESGFCETRKASHGVSFRFSSKSSDELDTRQLLEREH